MPFKNLYIFSSKINIEQSFFFSKECTHRDTSIHDQCRRNLVVEVGNLTHLPAQKRLYAKRNL